jgi:hypothetical protein
LREKFATFQETSTVSSGAGYCRLSQPTPARTHSISELKVLRLETDIFDLKMML